MSTGPIYGQPNYPTRIVPQFSGNAYIIEQKILSVRETFGIKDQTGILLAYVKREFVSFGPRFWFESPNGEHLGQIHGKVVAIRPTFEIYDGQGQLRAQVKKKLVKLFGEAWWMEDPSGNEIAKINGNVLEHDYYIQDMNGNGIAQIHKKWITVRDSYSLEMLNPYFDPYLALAYAISLDNTEKKEDKGKHGLFR